MLFGFNRRFYVILIGTIIAYLIVGAKSCRIGITKAIPIRPLSSDLQFGNHLERVGLITLGELP